MLVAKIAKEIFHHVEYVNYLNIFNILLDFARFILVREEVFQNQEIISNISYFFMILIHEYLFLR